MTPAASSSDSPNSPDDRVSKDLVDMTKGNDVVESKFNSNIVKKMNELITLIIGDDSLSEGDVMTVAYNFSWYFLTDHLRALKQSRYKHVRDNYDKFFMENIVAYLKVVAGQSNIIQVMLDNNLKTIDEYIEFMNNKKSTNDNTG